MSELIEFLTQGRHPIALNRYKDPLELRRRVERGYVLVKFTDTRGGTELGVKLDPARCDLHAADFEQGTGRVALAGSLTLDFVDIEVAVDIELGSMTGTGTVAVVAEATPSL